MEWKLTREPLASLATDAIVVFHYQERESALGVAREIDEALGFRISNLISLGEITGELNEVTALHNWGKIPSGRVFVIGLGKESQLDLHKFKNAVASVARAAKNKGVKSLGIGCPSFIIERYNAVDVVQSIVEGVEFGSYGHHAYKREHKKKQIESVWISNNILRETAFEAGAERGQIFARATNYARYLVNEPSNRLTPAKLAEEARQIAEKRKLKADILDVNRLRELGMHALLSVAQAGAHDPFMIVLSYQGSSDSKEILGLIGKGVTFDAGGLQIKPSQGMDEMKDDMAGAAAVLAAMDAVGQLQPHANVLAIVPTCENGVGKQAYRPGDVISTFSGKTIEVHHTDAEGRIILADAISYAKRLGVTKMVDVATLTGAIGVALGHEATGLMTNDEEWAKEVKAAARIAGERVWELPMYEEYEEYLKSDIADLKNEGGHPAGAIQGGMFLKAFAEDTPFVHLDIGGTVQVPGEKGIYVKGATGVMARTLIQLAMRC
ncbi:leucyl aminopeptidase [Thermoactinomyces mirandus]|uniref:Probable cytosol aminopeptidase n=1 Tax=Thermoactinomyces mirandus TaxID=2756294 RepID=A0A7W1XQ58_9BACL|nr:leucyl aminopeptidase [Thermoactinomyces mirandus]MBA4601199.1 leucyl aminopeptidase [Thermoactinomyces mirandus]